MWKRNCLWLFFNLFIEPSCFIKYYKVTYNIAPSTVSGSLYRIINLSKWEVPMSHLEVNNDFIKMIQLFKYLYNSTKQDQKSTAMLVLWGWRTLAGQVHVMCTQMIGWKWRCGPGGKSFSFFQVSLRVSNVYAMLGARL